MTHDSSTTIIGAGKVGQSLAQLMRHNGLNVQLLGRDLEQQYKVCQASDVVLLTVNDAAIEPLCDELSEHFKPKATVAHCSGALSSEILASAQRRGCATASLHPLNTFPSLEASLSLFSDNSHASYMFAEGDSTALSFTLPLFQKLGFNVVEIKQQNKALYHAACVFACNYLVSLMEMSLQTAATANIDRDQFWQALQPLIQTTLDNISDNGTSQSLSGPIARADTATVQKHLQELDSSSTGLSTSYAELGKQALKLAVERGELKTIQLDELKSILNAVNTNTPRKT